MVIFVKKTIGTTIAIIRAFFPSETVDGVKQKFQDMSGCPFNQQRLTFAGHLLEDGRNVGDYNIQNHNPPFIFDNAWGKAGDPPVPTGPPRWPPLRWN